MCIDDRFVNWKKPPRRFKERRSLWLVRFPRAVSIPCGIKVADSRWDLARKHPYPSHFCLFHCRRRDPPLSPKQSPNQGSRRCMSGCRLSQKQSPALARLSPQSPSSTMGLDNWTITRLRFSNPPSANIAVALAWPPQRMRAPCGKASLK